MTTKWDALKRFNALSLGKNTEQQVRFVRDRFDEHSLSMLYAIKLRRNNKTASLSIFQLACLTNFYNASFAIQPSTSVHPFKDEPLLHLKTTEWNPVSDDSNEQTRTLLSMRPLACTFVFLQVNNRRLKGFRLISPNLDMQSFSIPLTSASPAVSWADENWFSFF